MYTIVSGHVPAGAGLRLRAGAQSRTKVVAVSVEDIPHAYVRTGIGDQDSPETECAAERVIVHAGAGCSDP